MKPIALTVAVLLLGTSAHAATVEVDVVPSAWKLEAYVGGGPMVFFTSTTCTTNTNTLRFGSNAIVADYEKFWSLVMAAKLSSRRIFVSYDNTNCQIVSYGLSAT